MYWHQLPFNVRTLLNYDGGGSESCFSALRLACAVRLPKAWPRVHFPGWRRRRIACAFAASFWPLRRALLKYWPRAQSNTWKNFNDYLQTVADTPLQIVWHEWSPVQDCPSSWIPSEQLSAQNLPCPEYLPPPATPDRIECNTQSDEEFLFKQGIHHIWVPTTLFPMCTLGEPLGRSAAASLKFKDNRFE